MWVSLLLACADPAQHGIAGEPVQPAIQALLVVHVDPLPRDGGGACEDASITRCGPPLATAWRQRTENLGWLAEQWTRDRRTVDLQLGPESSLGWMEDPAVAGALARSFERAGDPDGIGAVAQTAARGRAALGALVGAGSATLGVHVHTVRSVGGGDFGDGLRITEGPGPCEAWEGDPMIEDPAAEAVVALGVAAAAPLAAAVGAELRSFTGHLPRTMAGKIQLLDDPDGLDPNVAVDFDARFAPANLGSAYSECLHLVTDHPPFEPWAAHDSRALAAGEGPLVLPGERVIGTLEEHLGAWADTAGPAARRRLWELLLNWRVAELRGDPPRPWVWSYHTHDFQLNPGRPDPARAEDRALRPVEGNSLRGDLLEVAEMIDELGSWAGWQGLPTPEDGLLRWSRSEALRGEGSFFDVGAEGEAPSALSVEDSPYLPLLAEALADGHQICEGALPEGVQVLGFGVCAAGWAWGGERPGFHCADGALVDRTYVLIPALPGCHEVGGVEIIEAAPVDGEAFGAPPDCGAGRLELPAEGLLLRASGPWVACPEGG
jgi:hypothetical protein